MSFRIFESFWLTTLTIPPMSLCLSSVCKTHIVAKWYKEKEKVKEDIA